MPRTAYVARAYSLVPRRHRRASVSGPCRDREEKAADGSRHAEKKGAEYFRAPRFDGGDVSTRDGKPGAGGAAQPDDAVGSDRCFPQDQLRTVAQRDPDMAQQ